ncbi:hypothetical protein [Actinoplanes sp. NBRC 103695]|uniref:hypothetical protein n=1 Tax=Actinoplanes sp. NBRC 103695 TaxID=3032202 RepID=UPI0024A3DF26|nr:hypothetical protein [Actinoplanes sp. NBRC 103695]GLZ00772.1 hypothetical protein Acsp02_80240 [Actinoplanes sp. NBRC 103695]
MSLPRSARPAAASATSGSVSTSPARNDRWPASTATDRPHTSAPTDRAPSHDPHAEQWAGFVTELLALGFDPADLVSVAAQAAADRDYPHDVRDLISRRACQLAQHACTPTAAAALFAVRTRAIVLDDAGHHQQAAELWGQLITRHENANQPGPAQQARLAHATCLHRQGRCFEALDQVLLAWQTATKTADEDAPTVATVVRLYRLMLDACHSRAGTTVTRPAIPGMAEQPTDGGGTVPIAGAFEHRRVCAYQARTTSKGHR